MSDNEGLPPGYDPAWTFIRTEDGVVEYEHPAGAAYAAAIHDQIEGIRNKARCGYDLAAYEGRALVAEIDRLRSALNDHAERIARAIELLPATQDLRFSGRDGAARQMREDAAGIARGYYRCGHCATWGPPGTDHSCTCPKRDDDCTVVTHRDYTEAARLHRRDTSPPARGD